MQQMQIQAGGPLFAATLLVLLATLARARIISAILGGAVCGILPVKSIHSVEGNRKENAVFPLKFDTAKSPREMISIPIKTSAS